MAETLISPGVLTRENDQSFITTPPAERGAAIIGPAVLGPIERPTLVSSFSAFLAVFGSDLESGSNEYSYLTSIAANQYFQNGGSSLLVTRVVSASSTWAPATSSLIATSSGAPGGTSTSTRDGLSPFVLETISSGEIMNTGTDELTGGALTSGTSDNIRWEIASVNTASGVFSLLIRRGNDTNNNKVILESYNNISLDPFSTNYIGRAIGDLTTTVKTEGADTYIQESGSFPNISSYVRVKQVNYNTPNYFNNDGTFKPEFTSSLPIVSSGSFGAGNGKNVPTDSPAALSPINFYEAINSSNTQGLKGTDYTTAIALLANVDDYQYNVISVPGLYYKDYATQINSVMNNTIARGDSIAVIDLVPYNTGIAEVVTQAGTIDNSYSAAYWPWIQTVDPSSGLLVFVPASTFVPGVYAFTDASSDPWFAPAGIT